MERLSSGERQRLALLRLLAEHEGDLVTNTEGMLPEADFVFLDELLNANSAILNSLLMVLNERIFRRGRETRALPTLMVIGASNRLQRGVLSGQGLLSHE